MFCAPTNLSKIRLESESDDEWVLANQDLHTIDIDGLSLSQILPPPPEEPHRKLDLEPIDELSIGEIILTNCLRFCGFAPDKEKYRIS